MPHLVPIVVVALLGWHEPSQAPASPVDVVEALQNALVDAIARAEPSIVAIARDKDAKTEETSAVRGRNPLPPRQDMANFGMIRPFEEPEPDYIASDYGSGVVVGDQGQILTSFHVVRGASRLRVRALGVREFDAEVIAADPRSDLAVIVPREIPGRVPPRLKPIVVGDAGSLRKGMFLLALGNPFNAGRDGRASASWGILANVARRIDPGLIEPFKKQLRNYPTLLQLDAKLNLGMSGGAVVNLKGELVGLTTNAANAGGFDTQAGYALPMDILARRAIESLRNGQEVEYGFLGVELPSDNSNRIANVQPGTPAGEGGLIADDAVLAIGGLPVVDSDTLVMAVNAFKPGTPIKLRILRNEQEIERTVVLSKLRVHGEVIATNRPVSWRGLRVDFVSTLNNAALGNALLDAMAKGGVVIAEVQPGSTAEDAGLKPGQVIVKVEDEIIRNPADFTKAIATKNGPVTVTIEGDRTFTIK